MQEGVASVRQGWLAALAIGAMAAVYFGLMHTTSFPEPGANIVYDIKAFEDLDNIEAAYAEIAAAPAGVESPRALAAAGDGYYVAGRDAIAAFDAQGRETRRVAVAGTPQCLAVAADGTVYAGLEKQVTVIDAAGQVVAEWKDFTPRSYLTAIAVAGDDVYVADAGKRVVLRFDRAGAVQARIGEKDPARDVPGLEVPSPYLDLAANPDGELWVVNPGKLGLEQYRRDGSIVTSWYRPALTLDSFPGCCNPTHIAFDPSGALIAAEKGLTRIKRFEVTAGAYEGLVAASEVFPSTPSVRDLAVDAQGRVLVLDPKRNAVRIFARKESPDGKAA